MRYLVVARVRAGRGPSLLDAVSSETLGRGSVAWTERLIITWPLGAIRWRTTRAVRFLTMAALLAGLMVGCDAGTEDAAATPSRYGESPLLRERVEAGELPPVEQRLPNEPMVVDTPEIGEYGGTMGGGRAIQSDRWRPPGR